MSPHQPISVDQALFGYADGHRQIAASVRLPSKDQYQLAAATDLASGARLAADDSYLTGLPLAESRKFALIRTWPAPEMPRPGCVWSHVLIIDLQTLSTHGDLADFLALLRRPHDRHADAYGEPLVLRPYNRSAMPPDSVSVFELIRSYYSGRAVFLNPDVDAGALEASIMAVWSQQWPRLRASFSFRTAAGGERRRSELIDYDVQVGAPGSTADEQELAGDKAQFNWVAAGAADAAAAEVTALRRFLWRYGRDLAAPRRHYRTLVELFLAVEGKKELPSEQAIHVFDILPEAGDAEILKRDILGLNRTTPPLIPPLPLANLVEVLASERMQHSATENDMQQRFADIRPDQIGPLAAMLDRNGSKLGRWEGLITNRLIACADRNAVLGDMPSDIRRQILLGRPELVDAETIDLLPDDAVLELASLHAADEVGAKLAQAAVRRDFGGANARLFKATPLTVFEAAIDAARLDELNAAWIRVLGDGSSAVIDAGWPANAKSTTNLAIGLSLLRFPRALDRSADYWADVLAALQNDASGDRLIRLQAFLLRSALLRPMSASWKLIAAVLPQLRPVILRGELPNDVYQMLSSDLPKFNNAGYWDINKRILIRLSQLKKSFPDDAGTLAALDLIKDERDTVTYGADDEERSKKSFWWW